MDHSRVAVGIGQWMEWFSSILLLRCLYSDCGRGPCRIAVGRLHEVNRGFVALGCWLSLRILDFGCSQVGNFCPNSACPAEHTFLADSAEFCNFAWNVLGFGFIFEGILFVGAWVRWMAWLVDSMKQVETASPKYFWFFQKCRLSENWISMLERLAFCAVEKVQCWFQRRFVVHVGSLNGLGCKVQVEAFDPKYVSRHCVKKRSLWKFGSFGRVVVPGKQLKEILEFLMTLLLCHGIEPNPGPIEVVVSSCNVQSPNGVWSLLDYVARDSRLNVVAIQEVRMNERELETFRRAAKRRGYKLFCVVGRPTVARWGHRRECGGVCYLVDSRLQAREQVTKTGESLQLLGIWLEDWFFGNCYAPPDAVHRHHDPRQELAEFFEEALIEGGIDGRWLLMGDCNEEPGEGISELFEAHRGHVLGVGRSTRWDGDREVDWFATNSVAQVSRPTWEEVHIADHLLIRTVVACRDRELQSGFLKTGPVWKRPASVSRQDWLTLLVDCYSLCSGKEELRALMRGPIDVELEWECFMTLLDDLMRRAYARLPLLGVTDFEARAASAGLRSDVLKGLVPQHKTRPSVRVGSLSHAGDMGVHKLRKKGARLYELKCVLMRLQQETVDSEPLRFVAAALIRKLRLRDGGWTLRTVLHHLGEAKEALLTQVKAQREARLTEWKRRMNSDPKFVGRWLKSRKSVVGVELLSRHGEGCDSKHEAVDAIADYWEDFLANR